MIAEASSVIWLSSLTKNIPFNIVARDSTIYLHTVVHINCHIQYTIEKYCTKVIGTFEKKRLYTVEVLPFLIDDPASNIFKYRYQDWFRSLLHGHAPAQPFIKLNPICLYNLCTVLYALNFGPPPAWSHRHFLENFLDCGNSDCAVSQVFFNLCSFYRCKYFWVLP